MVLIPLATAVAGLAAGSQSRSAGRGGGRGAGSMSERTERQEDFGIVIKKSERQLFLYGRGRRLLKVYRIALGRQPVGMKREQGDGATPEGDYFITHKNPRSKFYLSLGLSYPNLADAEAGLTRRLISPSEHEDITRAIGRGELPPQQTGLGGDIFIHGGGTEGDWTLGCIALENEEIKELFELLPVKTPVKILS